MPNYEGYMVQFLRSITAPQAAAAAAATAAPSPDAQQQQEQRQQGTCRRSSSFTVMHGP